MQMFNSQTQADQLRRHGAAGVDRQVNTNSSAKGNMPGDVVLSIAYRTATREGPDDRRGEGAAGKGGRDSQPVKFVVLRDGRKSRSTTCCPTCGSQGSVRLSVALSIDDARVVAERREVDRASRRRAGGRAITAINGQPVKNWFDVKR